MLLPLRSITTHSNIFALYLVKKDITRTQGQFWLAQLVRQHVKAVQWSIITVHLVKQQGRRLIMIQVVLYKHVTQHVVEGTMLILQHIPVYLVVLSVKHVLILLLNVHHVTLDTTILLITLVLKYVQQEFRYLSGQSVPLVPLFV